MFERFHVEILFLSTLGTALGGIGAFVAKHSIRLEHGPGLALLALLCLLERLVLPVLELPLQLLVTTSTDSVQHSCVLHLLLVVVETNLVGSGVLELLGLLGSSFVSSFGFALHLFVFFGFIYFVEADI
jgi:hypothetical protein